MKTRCKAAGAAFLLALAPLGWGCSDAGPSRTEPQRSEAPASPAPGKPTASPAANPGAGSAESLKDKGRAVYVANCTACHNPDPHLPGNLGPEVAGSSQALLEARILHNSYPEGYTPKRDSRVMVALPYLKDDIPALGAYLAP